MQTQYQGWASCFLMQDAEYSKCLHHHCKEKYRNEKSNKESYAFEWLSHKI